MYINHGSYSITFQKIDIGSQHLGNILQGQEKNMCGSGYPAYPKFLLPTLKLFSSNSEVGRE